MSFYSELYGLQRSVPRFSIFYYFFLMKTIIFNHCFLYIYNKNILKNYLKKQRMVRLRQVFAEPNAIYFITLRCIMNAWSNFEPQLLGKHILIIFLLRKRIKHIFVLFALTICIKKMPGVSSIAMKSIRTSILTS